MHNSTSCIEPCRYLNELNMENWKVMMNAVFHRYLSFLENYLSYKDFASSYNHICECYMVYLREYENMNCLKVWNVIKHQLKSWANWEKKNSSCKIEEHWRGIEQGTSGWYDGATNSGSHMKTSSFYGFRKKEHRHSFFCRLCRSHYCRSA